MTDRTTLDDTQVVELVAQPTVAVRVQQPMRQLDLASAFDRNLPLVAARIETEGGAIAGPPFGRYHAFGPDQVDVEIGFPVAEPLASLPSLSSAQPGDVGNSELPGGPVARTVYRGSYEGLSGAYDALHEWIHAQPGYDDSAGPWESYVDDPGAVADQSELRTEIVWPLVAD